ncbi:AI-2E family transporter [Ilumatobacter sp.]|uniref:AI-2E family transporter n=1 Tax=Ilumatobacter sp. TaxID=1967498 RepID=UPI003AF58394
MTTPESNDRRHLPVWFSRLSRYSWGFIGVAAAIAVIVYALGALRELVIPLVLAAFFAVVLEPAVGWLAGRRIPRAIGSAIMIVVVGLVISGAFAIVVYGIAEQTDEISDRLTEAQVEVEDYLSQSQLGDYVETIREGIDDSGSVVRDGAGARIGTFLGSAAGFASGFVLGVVLLYYLLKDGAALSASFIASRRPTDREQVNRVVGQAAASIRAYFRGKTALAFAQGIFAWIALGIMGVPLSGSVGVVNFIGAYIPFLGAFIGGAFAVLMAISEGGIGLAIGALAVVVFMNLVLENVLEPKFLGASLKMHPIVVLLATVGGGVVAGMVGLILGAPLTSIGINLFRELQGSGFFSDDELESESSEPAVVDSVDADAPVVEPGHGA